MAGTVYSGNVNTQAFQPLLSNFQIALLNPILSEKCIQLSQLLQDTPLKEIQYVYPALIENIFGVRNGMDWGFLKLDKENHARDFETLRLLLAPDGPILKVAYKFTEEISPKFEFPFTCLPMPSQMLLNEGKVPALYANKLHSSSPGVFSPTLQLNAFEFYFFHFCYFIVNPAMKNSTSTVNQQDTLYAHILEDYLSYFLPTENRAVPLFQTQNVQHSPILTSSLSSSYGSPHSTSENRHPFSVLNTNHARPDFLGPVKQKPSLLKKGTIMMVTSPSSGSSTGFGSSPAESWRSETFILILKEMYLNQNSADQQQQSMLDLIPKIFIPTHYHVWMVRNMVKHLHFFFNTTLSPNQSTGHGQIMIDSLGRLKSLGMTQLIQKEMYCFLKTVFDHWPLDASFRVPLETYLSFIQPWRYIQCDLEPSVWQKFMTENLLFYTTIFHQVLKRFLRMDLCCPKNVYMLYRLTKVICTGELREMIMQAEKGCISKPSNVGMPGFLRSSEKLSYQKISQLEITGSNYVPLFSEPVFSMVSHLLSSISAAREKVNSDNITVSSPSKGFLATLSSFFETSSEDINSDDNSPLEMKKVASYLDLSFKNLCSFFQEVTPTLNTSSSFSHLTSTPGISRIDDSPNSHTNKFPNYSSIEQMQVLNKKKKRNITYNGNPDLQPVRTYEVGFLVEFLNKVSQQLNDKYGTEIEQIYNQETFIGKISRRVLAAPFTYHNVLKSKDMMSVSWCPIHLPPRVNLRVLAHKKLLAYVILILVLNYFCSSSPILGIFLIIMFLLILLFLSVLLYPVPLHVKED